MKCAIALFVATLPAQLALGQTAAPIDAATQKKIDALGNLPMSSAHYYSILQSLGVQPAAPSGPSQAPVVPDLPELPDISTGGPYQVTNDTYQDAEPSVTTGVKSGTRYFTTAFFRYTGATPTPRIRSVRVADGFSTFQAATPALPPRPPGATLDYNDSFDPYVVTNNGSGPGAGRLYLVGACSNNTTYTDNPNGIYVWRSDDAGLTWTSPVQVAALANNHDFLLDKPHIAVNPNNGYVFVTYLRYATDPNQTVSFVSRSTDGGLTFSANPVAVVTDRIGGPQVAVNTQNNNVYLVWADYNGNRIRVATSTNSGLTFPAQSFTSIGARNSLLGPCGTNCPHLRSGIRALSLPIARYNTAAHVLGVTWHEREPGTSGDPAITDACYAYYDGSQWLPATPLKLNGAASGTDNFQPALDSDLHGNVYFVWYDTNYDATGRKYKTAWTYTTYTGGFISGISIAGFQSYPIGANNVLASIGDYQDIVSVPFGAYGRFVHAWVGVPTSTLHDDIYFWDHYE